MDPIRESAGTYNRDFALVDEGDPAGAYGITLHWSEIDGRLECVGVDLRTRKGEPVTTSMLRRVPLARIIAEHRREEADYLREVLEPRNLTGARWKEEAARLLTAVERGQVRYDAEHWEAVAQVYREAYAHGNAPTRAVAEAFQVSRSAAAKWVSRCREKGLLGPTEQRRPGGAGAWAVSEAVADTATETGDENA